MCAALWIEGTTTTPFDMVVLNKMSRYHLAIDALKHVSAAAFAGFGRSRHVQSKTVANTTTTFDSIWRHAGDHQLALDGGFQRANRSCAAGQGTSSAKLCSAIAKEKSQEENRSR